MVLAVAACYESPQLQLLMIRRRAECGWKLILLGPLYAGRGVTLAVYVVLFVYFSNESDLSYCLGFMTAGTCVPTTDRKPFANVRVQTPHARLLLTIANNLPSHPSLCDTALAP